MANSSAIERGGSNTHDYRGLPSNDVEEWRRLVQSEAPAYAVGISSLVRQKYIHEIYSVLDHYRTYFHHI
jgi:hypothetical protein